MSLLTNSIGKMLQRLMWLRVLIVLCVGSAGCAGLPARGWAHDVEKSTPGNHLDLGGGRGIDINEDTDVVIAGLDVGRDGLFKTHCRATSITLRQSKASWDGVHGAQDRNNVSRELYFRHVNDVMDRVPPILDRFVPLAKDYIAMAGNVAMQKLQKPGLIQQIVAAVGGGHFDMGLVKGVFDPIDPSIATEALAQLPAQAAEALIPAVSPKS